MKNKLFIIVLLWLCLACSPLRFNYICSQGQIFSVNTDFTKLDISVYHYDYGNSVRGVHNALIIQADVNNFSQDTLHFHVEDINVSSKLFHYKTSFIMELEGKKQNIFVKPNESKRIVFVLENEIEPKNSKALAKLLKDEVMILESFSFRQKQTRVLVTQHLEWKIRQ
jgi:hypothetical protein